MKYKEVLKRVIGWKVLREQEQRRAEASVSVRERRLGPKRAGFSPRGGGPP